ncbi:hypothetical protein [Halalkalicoccus subterraneus]|uniref:hypothetical protein n=1 Tax=Halalkalicoccus subterraneus TaxID=2675002 RepID=UPI000EFA33FB|nr:hypothetical protein [Halalkalicoccus subterraneus]
MATIAEIHLPADEFALSYPFDTIEDVNIEIKRITGVNCQVIISPQSIASLRCGPVMSVSSRWLLPCATTAIGGTSLLHKGRISANSFGNEGGKPSIGTILIATEPQYLTRLYDISSERELQRELSRLFQSAYRNDVPIGPTWVCECTDRPDLELLAIKLAKSQDQNGES